MARYLFEDARYLAPGDDGLAELRRGWIAVEGDRIVALLDGPPEGSAFAGFERIDASRRAVSPGLVNAHTHTILLVLRGTVEDIEGNLVYQYMVPASYLLEPQERAAIARLGCLEAIRSGTTTLVDPLRHVADYAPAMIDSGLRLYLCESAADALTREVGRSGYRFDREWGETFLARSRALIERFHGAADDRVRVMVAAHAPDNCSPWMLAELNRLARDKGLRRTIHLSQIVSEVEQVRTLHGKTSTEYLRDNDWLADDLLAVHWTFCTEADVEILAHHGVHFAHCPASMSAKGPHRLPIKAILESGVNITLGTDNMTEDLFHAMKLALVVHRGAYGRSVTPGPRQVLDYATANAAKALGRDDLGRIAVGMKADLALFDLEAPALAPRLSLVSNLVHYGHPGVVTDVLVDGRFLLRDGRATTLDERQVVAEAQAATEAMWARFERQEGGVPLPQRDTV
ncbi:5-methylthioadenosine/S-adenosylhomocysteine deaminase [Tistlia consotensis]|uniref:5-methylthioadenosine/S-adenosylhomocysteine deaminase n=1 Tax=Tistlia consotensis USBA 355 TaxID=560819 RepID=A0A1Y6BBQ2_9PROT|nr:amidohydrolase family protein [Tistlia consotensis]SME92636.1 5-methylthioadenosine/S-adenosylhomocysteine deaminase [Tistlia consotensis USBA 355]SNR28149.1 5-methylthioadenosine/S-adenosylhomocysteine deaminase [Tistlia consotensis]